MVLNEIPWNGVFVEITVDYLSHGYSDDVPTCNIMMFNYKYINGNEVQYLMIYFFNTVSILNFIPISVVICTDMRDSVIILLDWLLCLIVFWLILLCGFFGLFIIKIKKKHTFTNMAIILYSKKTTKQNQSQYNQT